MSSSKQSPDAHGGRRAAAAARYVGGALEVAVATLVVVTPLFLSSNLTSNLLAKSAIGLILSGVVVLLWTVLVALKGRLRLLQTPLYLPFLVFLVMTLISLAFAPNQIRGLEVVLTQVLMFLFFVAVAHHFHSRRQISRILWAIILTSVVVSLVGILQYNGLDPLGLPQQYGRLPLSTLGNTNFVAHYLDLLIPLTATLLLLSGARLWQKLVLAATLALTGVHMLLTSNRGGWLSVGLSLGLLVALSFRGRRWRRRQVLAVVVVAAALVSPVGEFALQSIHLESGKTVYSVISAHLDRTVKRAVTIFDEADFSRSMRMLIWSDTAAVIKAHPFIGVGPGNFEYFLPGYRSVPGQRAWATSAKLMGNRSHVPYYAHNEYLEFWAETGTVGMAAMIWLSAGLLLLGIRFSRHTSTVEDDGDRDCDSTWSAPSMTIGILCALAAAIVHAFFSFNLQDPTSATLFWLLAGLMIAVNSAGMSAVVDISIERKSRRTAVLATGGLIAVLGGYAGLCMLVGDAYYFQALRHAKYQHYDSALGLLRQAVDWRGHEFRHHHDLGRIAHHRGLYAEAEAALRRTLELHPNNEAAMRLLGKTLIGRERAPEAIPVLKRAVAIDPLTPDNHTLLAEAQRHAGQYEEAVEVRMQALALRPDDARLMMSLGIEYQNAGLGRESIAVLERAAKVAPSDAMIRGNLGAAYLHAGQLQEAATSLDEAIRLDPNRVEWRTNLTLAHMLLGDFDRALREGERARELDPHNEGIDMLIQQLRALIDESSPEIEASGDRVRVGKD